MYENSGERGAIWEVEEHGPLLDTVITAYNEHFKPTDPREAMSIAVNELAARSAQLAENERRSAAEHVASSEMAEALGTAAVLLAIENSDAERTPELAVHPAAAETALSTAEVARRLETEHVVKLAPRFIDQAEDASRTNVITRIAGQDKGHGTRTGHPRFAGDRVTETEHDVLAGLQEYLQTAATASSVLDERQMGRARAMLESLTFIGKQEYDEAAAGIAESWKLQLEANPKLQILAMAGGIGDRYARADGPREIKSDEFLLDSILANFSNAECLALAGRLITDASEISVTNAEDLKAVMLDDWTVSGTQLSDERQTFLQAHPEFAGSLEVQLITANRERVTGGLAFRDEDDTHDQPPTPVRAYYLAHHSAWANDSDAHVTGAHASVDYDAEDLWEDITKSANEAADLHSGLAILKEMPAAANIVRPYRMDGAALDSVARLNHYNQLKAI